MNLLKKLELNLPVTSIRELEAFFFVIISISTGTGQYLEVNVQVSVVSAPLL